MTVQDANRDALGRCKMRGCNLCDGYRKELEQYRALGTVEELKEAREKQIPKKPIYRDFKEDDEGEKMIPHKAECQVCGYEFEFGEWNDIDNPYCKCGQKIDWEEGEI